MWLINEITTNDRIPTRPTIPLLPSKNLKAYPPSIYKPRYPFQCYSVLILITLMIFLTFTQHPAAMTISPIPIGSRKSYFSGTFLCLSCGTNGFVSITPYQDYLLSYTAITLYDESNRTFETAIKHQSRSGTLNVPIDLSHWNNKLVSYIGELTFHEARDPSFNPISSKLTILTGLTSLISEKLYHQWVYPFQPWLTPLDTIDPNHNNILVDFPSQPPSQPQPPSPDSSTLSSKLSKFSLSATHRKQNNQAIQDNNLDPIIIQSDSRRSNHLNNNNDNSSNNLHEDDDFPYDYVLYTPQILIQNYTSVTNLRGFSLSIIGTSQWVSTEILSNTCSVNNVELGVLINPLGDLKRLDILFTPEMIEITRYWHKNPTYLTINCNNGYHIRYNSSLDAKIGIEMLILTEIYDDSPPNNHPDFDQEYSKTKNSNNISCIPNQFNQISTFPCDDYTINNTNNNNNNHKNKDNSNNPTSPDAYLIYPRALIFDLGYYVLFYPLSIPSITPVKSIISPPALFPSITNAQYFNCRTSILFSNITYSNSPFNLTIIHSGLTIPYLTKQQLSTMTPTQLPYMLITLTPSQMHTQLSSTVQTHIVPLFNSTVNINTNNVDPLGIHSDVESYNIDPDTTPHMYKTPILFENGLASIYPENSLFPAPPPTEPFSVDISVTFPFRNGVYPNYDDTNKGHQIGCGFLFHHISPEHDPKPQIQSSNNKHQQYTKNLFFGLEDEGVVATQLHHSNNNSNNTTKSTLQDPKQLKWTPYSVKPSVIYSSVQMTPIGTRPLPIEQTYITVQTPGFFLNYLDIQVNNPNKWEFDQIVLTMPIGISALNLVNDDNIPQKINNNDHPSDNIITRCYAYNTTSPYWLKHDTPVHQHRNITNWSDYDLGINVNISELDNHQVSLEISSENSGRDTFGIICPYINIDFSMVGLHDWRATSLSHMQTDIFSENNNHHNNNNNNNIHFKSPHIPPFTPINDYLTFNISRPEWKALQLGQDPFPMQMEMFEQINIGNVWIFNFYQYDKSDPDNISIKHDKKYNQSYSRHLVATTSTHVIPTQEQISFWILFLSVGIISAPIMLVIVTLYSVSQSYCHIGKYIPCFNWALWKMRVKVSYDESVEYYDKGKFFYTESDDEDIYEEYQAKLLLTHRAMTQSNVSDHYHIDATGHIPYFIVGQTGNGINNGNDGKDDSFDQTGGWFDRGNSGDSNIKEKKKIDKNKNTTFHPPIHPKDTVGVTHYDPHIYGGVGVDYIEVVLTESHAPSHGNDFDDRLDELSMLGGVPNALYDSDTNNNNDFECKKDKDVDNSKKYASLIRHHSGGLSNNTHLSHENSSNTAYNYLTNNNGISDDVSIAPSYTYTVTMTTNTTNKPIHDNDNKNTTNNQNQKQSPQQQHQQQQQQQQVILQSLQQTNPILDSGEVNIDANVLNMVSIYGGSSIHEGGQFEDYFSHATKNIQDQSQTNQVDEKLHRKKSPNHEFSIKNHNNNHSTSPVRIAGDVMHPTAFITPTINVTSNIKQYNPGTFNTVAVGVNKNNKTHQNNPKNQQQDTLRQLNQFESYTQLNQQRRDKRSASTLDPFNMVDEHREKRAISQLNPLEGIDKNLLNNNTNSNVGGSVLHDEYDPNDNILFQTAANLSHFSQSHEQITNDESKLIDGINTKNNITNSPISRHIRHNSTAGDETLGAFGAFGAFGDNINQNHAFTINNRSNSYGNSLNFKSSMNLSDFDIFNNNPNDAMYSIQDFDQYKILDTNNGVKVLDNNDSPSYTTPFTIDADHDPTKQSQIQQQQQQKQQTTPTQQLKAFASFPMGLNDITTTLNLDMLPNEITLTTANSGVDSGSAESEMFNTPVGSQIDENDNRCEENSDEGNGIDNNNSEHITINNTVLNQMISTHLKQSASSTSTPIYSNPSPPPTPDPHNTNNNSSHNSNNNQSVLFTPTQSVSSSLLVGSYGSNAIFASQRNNNNNVGSLPRPRGILPSASFQPQFNSQISSGRSLNNSTIHIDIDNNNNNAKKDKNIKSGKK